MKASPIRPYKKANITIKRQRMNKEEQERRKKSPVQIRNKKASFEYFFVDTYTAGIVLVSRDCDVNCSFETLLALSREKTERGAAKLLFAE